MESALKSDKVQSDYYIIIIKTHLTRMFWYLSQHPSTHISTYE